MNYLKRSFLIILLLIVAVVVFADSSKKIIINEFLASNSTGLQDIDGDYSDWIELYNPGSEIINLRGWRLTDTESKPAKWIFSSVTISPGQFLLVFASGKDRNVGVSELHTNFNLSKEGEYLALFEPDGTVADVYAPAFPPQEDDISYGYYQGQITYFEIPTPGTENSLETKAGIPAFSKMRGFYDNSFSVSLTVPNADTKIYYTTDGTRPTEQSTLYTTPISITKTTPLSAVGLKNGMYSAIIVNTYFFINDIVNQPNNPVGYPDRWGYLGSDIKYDNYAVGERAPADYAMDPNVCNDPSYKNLIENAFLSIPSVSIVTNPGYLFSDSVDEYEGGIYIHTGVTLGDGWERPVSIEYYEPSTEKQFQINCGLRLHGAASRQPEKSGKHSFRTVFRKTYGEGKLNFDLFDDDKAVTKFDHLVFRAGYNLSWLHPESGQRTNSQYIIDPFAKRTQLNMGHVSAHDRFVHFFINGLYWGVYDITERVGDKFMASYFEGEDVDFDIINHDGLADGEITAYNRMVELAKSGKYEQLLTEKLLDMENFIDYMLLNFYLGNMDWPHNNWYAARNWLNPDKGFRFFSWDAETSLMDVNNNRITGISGDFRRILFGSSSGFSETGGLYNNEDFLLLFADRVQKNFFNAGELTAGKTAELYGKIAEEIDLAIILESARWGDYRKNTLPTKNSQSPLYTRNEHWLPRKQKLLKDYFPKRTNVVYEQLKALNLVSKIDPPVFSSYGGVVSQPFGLSMSANEGVVYYTLNGMDPRVQVSGDVFGSALVYTTPIQIFDSCTVKARTKSGRLWSALSEAKFSGGSTSTVPVVSDEAVKTHYQNDAMSIVLPEQGNLRLHIYSVDGKCVHQISIYGQSGSNIVGLSAIYSGVYIYKIEFQGMTFFGKFIK